MSALNYFFMGRLSAVKLFFMGWISADLNLVVEKCVAD
jgi:hypothetical protein